jgi:hypothetical protein
VRFPNSINVKHCTGHDGVDELFDRTGHYYQPPVHQLPLVCPRAAGGVCRPVAAATARDRSEKRSTGNHKGR